MSSSSSAGGISQDRIHVTKKIAIDLGENQDAINQTIVSDTVSTEHGISVQDLTLPEESPEWAKVLLLAIKVNKTKLDTKFAEAKKESDGLTETISNLLTTVSRLSEANRSLSQENTQLKEDLL